MSSRRDSRVHLNERQNDALLEFENFKRKYLLVNKHITKLNSTLSVRVEDLNTQVSTLYAENLRLRASEISLASQLKKERKKTQKIMEQAENVIGVLMEHLTGMRNTMGGKGPAATPFFRRLLSSDDDNLAPTVKRKMPTSPVQPPREATRLARPPDELITEIPESDEEEQDTDGSDTPTRTVVTCRPSASRLPLPTVALPIASAQPDLPFQNNLAPGSTKRKSGRRNSSLLVVEHPPETAGRVVSPVNGPARRTRRSSLEERRHSLDNEEREVELQIQGVAESTAELEANERVAVAPAINGTKLQVVMEKLELPDRKGKGKQTITEWTRDIENQSASERESSESSKEKERRRFGIKDVTNSPRKLPSDCVVDEKPLEISVVTPKPSHTQVFETPTQKMIVPSLLSNVSTPATDNGSEAGETVNGRERRLRKSVNYAEPKLNTKMRKPDPPPSSLRSRPSTGAVARRRKSIPASSAIMPSDDDGDADGEGPGPGPRLTEGRRKTVHSTAVNGALTHAPTTDIVPPVPTISYAAWAAESRRHSTAA
ncbi:hypothetical protein BU17DRAFT_71822 [Hysterangium stoloniferum]|nr:hypothetical protein BU17DRAFT_71822 [Hysterangium stoloniferum]